MNTLKTTIVKPLFLIGALVFAMSSNSQSLEIKHQSKLNDALKNINIEKQPVDEKVQGSVDENVFFDESKQRYFESDSDIDFHTGAEFLVEEFGALTKDDFTRDSELYQHTDDSASLSARSNYTPACYKLNINTLYHLTPAVGGSYCIYFSITKKSRTQFLAFNQTAQRQVNIDVFQDKLANHTFTRVGSSYKSGASDSVLYFTEPGHYYLQMKTVRADGKAIKFVAASNTVVDLYEPNDSYATSYKLPNGRYNKIYANLDHPSDVDHFKYTALQGQDLVVGVYNDMHKNELKFELLNGTKWIDLKLNTRYDLSGLNPLHTVYIRVSQKAGKPHDRGSYRVLFGPKISDILKVSVNPPPRENLVRMTYDSSYAYYPTQVHNNVLWQATIHDSKKKPIEGVKIIFKYGATEVPGADSSALTNKKGLASKLVKFPDCTGDYVRHHLERFGAFAGRWKTEYDVGGWYMTVPDTTVKDDIGVGGSIRHPYVRIAHICKQTYLGR